MLEIVQENWRAYLWTDGTHWSGLAVTLWLLVFSMVAALLLSLPLAMARNAPQRWLSAPVWLYTYVVRGTPLYVQLLAFYVGVYSLDAVRSSALLNEFFRSGLYCAMLAFALNTCAYTTEVLAGALRAVPRGEVEAASAYGMSPWTIARRITWPNALRRALPGLSNEVIIVLHTTSLAFTATVPDLLKVARDINAATYDTFSAFGIAALLYALTTFLIVTLFRRLERHYLAFLQPAGAAR